MREEFNRDEFESLNDNMVENNNNDRDFAIGKDELNDQSTKYFSEETLGSLDSDYIGYDNDDAIAEKQPKIKAPSKGNKPKKKKGCMAAIIWVIVIFFISACLAVTAIFIVTDYMGIGFDKTIEVEISQGSNTEEIAKLLEEKGVIRLPLFFRLYSKLNGYDSLYKYGLYVFKPDTGYSTIADTLMNDGKQAETVEVMIPEGATIDKIAEILAQKGVCTADEFKKVIKTGEFKYDFISAIPAESVYYRLEGYLYPDTYRFYNYGGETNAKQAIDKMLKNFADKVEQSLIVKAREQGRTFHEVLTMASIINLEANSANYEDKCKVSAVFYNRLAWTNEPNLLGSTPTAEYPYGNGRYNTNKTPGLPPGPLCAPNIDCIKAAVNPTPEFAYDYFVTDSEMKFYYNKTYTEHMKTIKSLKAQGKWI